jgi:exonuclease III
MRPTLAVLMVCTLWLSTPCPAQDGPPEVPSVPGPTGDLRVMVWNVQRGAAAFDDGPSKALAWVRAAEPDIVLLQESYEIEGQNTTLGRWMAAALGWDHHQGDSPHLCILSPLRFEQTYFHEPWHAIGARLRDDEDRSVVVYSIWIDYRAYLPYALRDDPDISDADLLAHETDKSGRMEQTRRILDHLRRAGHFEGVEPPPGGLGGPAPLLVGGDWNCPSHLDWTPHAALVFQFRRALALPVSLAMAEAGFVDAFRAVRPSPVRDPGFTWSPLDLGTPEKPETTDRIDRLYMRPSPDGGVSLRPIEAFTLPIADEPPDRSLAERAFPSDHAALIVDFVWD